MVKQSRARVKLGHHKHKSEHSSTDDLDSNLIYSTATTPHIQWKSGGSGFRQSTLDGRVAAVAVGSTIFCFGRCIKYSKLFRRLFKTQNYMHFSTLNTKDTSLTWQKLTFRDRICHLWVTKPNTPHDRVYHTVVAKGDFIYLWGGFCWSQDSRLIYILNTKTLEWTKPEMTGEWPIFRYRHSAVIIRNKMYIFGGVTWSRNELELDNQYLNDLWALNLKTLHWSQIQTLATETPSPCSGHLATVYNNRFMIIFGAELVWQKHHVSESNLIQFDVKSREWSLVNTFGAKPPLHKGYCAFMCNGFLHTFGGTSNLFNDLFRYDPVLRVWHTLTAMGERPDPRQKFGCIVVKKRVFIFGGKTDAQKALGDTYVLEIPSLKNSQNTQKERLIGDVTSTLDIAMMPSDIQKSISSL